MRLFDKKQPELNEVNLVFYAHIGLITVRFAELESLITHIIERLINSDNDIISNTLIEKNNLATNLELLNKINRNRGYEEEKIKMVISKINKSKKVRNFFVHGVWSEVIKNENDVYTYCSNHKHIYERMPNGQRWIRYQSEKFTLKNLQSEINKIDDILLILKELWINMKEVDFRYDY